MSLELLKWRKFSIVMLLSSLHLAD